MCIRCVIITEWLGWSTSDRESRQNTPRTKLFFSIETVQWIIEKLLELLNWCNILMNGFLPILHHFKNSRSFSIILLYGVGGSSRFINYGTMKMRTVQLKMRTVLWKWEHYNAILYNTFLNQLTVAYWRHMATQMWVNTGSGNGLVPDGTEPLPEPMLTSHQWGAVAFIWEQFQS